MKSRKRNETPQGTQLSRAWTGSFLLCYARPLAGRQKNVISGNQQKPMPTSLERTVGEIKRGRRANNKTEEVIHRSRRVR